MLKLVYITAITITTL